MHRWSFRRTFLWLLPVVLVLGVLCVLLLAAKGAGAGYITMEERALADMTVARTLVLDGVYGLQADRPSPAMKEAGWRLLLAGLGWFVRSVRVAALLLGALCAVGSLLLLVRMAKQLFPFPPFILYAAILLVAMPGLANQALSGTSRPLATLLATAAAMLHVEGLQGRRKVLPPGAAALAGALVWIRVEFLALWIVFWIHAVCFAAPGGQGASRRGSAAVRGLSGLLLIALFLLPVLARNLRLLAVPWPQTPGAPLSAQAWSALSPWAFFGRSLGTSLDTLPGLLASASDVPILQNALSRLFVWFGALLIAGLAGWRQEERPFTLILFELLLVPLLLACMAPYLGTGGLSTVMGSMAPMFALAAAFGIFRAPFLAEQLYRKWKEGLPAAQGFALWWTAAGGLLLLTAILSMGRFVSRTTREMADRARLRQSVTEALVSGRLTADRVATDAPGWMAFAHDLRVMDLTGEFNTDLLTRLDADGSWEADSLRAYFREQRPSSMVLWGPDEAFFERLAPPAFERVRKGGDSGPLVIAAGDGSAW